MEKQKSKKKILVIVAIILLLAIISIMGIVIYKMMNKTEEPEVRERAVSAGLVVDGNIDKKKDEARFTTDMNMVWTFPSGSRISNNAIIGNSASNRYECYFEVYLNDEEQTLLYSSPILPIGTRLDQLELEEALPDGT